jgi:hypothetical protein
MADPAQEVRHTLTDIVLRVIETGEQLRNDTYNVCVQEGAKNHY